MVGPEAFVVVGCCFCLDPSVLILAFIFIVLDTTVPCLAALFKENYVLFSGMISCCESPRSHWSSFQPCLCIPGVGEDRTQKHFSDSRLSLSPTLPRDSGMLFLQTLGESESSSAFSKQLKTRLFLYQWLHRHSTLPSFFSLCVCVFSMWQRDWCSMNHSHHSWLSIHVWRALQTDIIIIIILTA